MAKCIRCDGKGECRQVVSFFSNDPDDVDIAWDTCPECDGTGEEPKREYEDEVWDV